MTEFELIARYFDRPARRARLGVGDDCALLAPSAGKALAVSTDMLVAGRHFFDDADPESLGWKTLAVNLSDLAAMGATPLAFTLAVALPSVDEPWLAAFSRGLFACATRYDCELIGGDTTRGPLTLSVTIFGEVDESGALRRDRARPGDDVWVSGSLGRAALALRSSGARRGGASIVVSEALQAALDRPVPRVELGKSLVGVAHAAIDVSDGFLQDFGHVLTASGVGAILDEAMPIGDELRRLDDADAACLALGGGDDYELCFTAPRTSRDVVVERARTVGVPVSRIGSITAETGIEMRGAAATVGEVRGFDHFATGEAAH